MALVGFYAAIGPTVLAQDLHVANHAVAGALFFELESWRLPSLQRGAYPVKCRCWSASAL